MNKQTLNTLGGPPNKACLQGGLARLSIEEILTGPGHNSWIISVCCIILDLHASKALCCLHELFYLADIIAC